MMNRKTIFFIVGILVFLAGLILFKNNIILGGQQERSAKNGLDSLILATGGRHPVVNESLRGKIVVINVWATWCGPCIKEIPELNKMVNDFKSEKVVFLALTDGDVVEDSKLMLENQLQFDYKLLFSEQVLINALYSFALPTEVKAIPMNVILNPEGKIEQYYIGSHDDDIKKMRQYLQTAAR